MRRIGQERLHGVQIAMEARQQAVDRVDKLRNLGRRRNLDGAEVVGLAGADDCSNDASGASACLTPNQIKPPPARTASAIGRKALVRMRRAKPSRSSRVWATAILTQPESCGWAIRRSSTAIRIGMSLYIAFWKLDTCATSRVVKGKSL